MRTLITGIITIALTCSGLAAKKIETIVSFRRACVTRLPNPCKFYFYLQEKMYARAYP